MTARAQITIHPASRGSWTVTDESTITVLVDGIQVASGPVGESDGGGHLARPRRVVAGLAALGWKPVRYHDPTDVPDHWTNGQVEGFEIDVEALS